MAKRITKNKVQKAANRILNEESCLQKEACDLGITMKDLDEKLKELYPGGTKNRAYKTVIDASNKAIKKLSKEDIDGYEAMLKQISEEKERKARKVVKKEETPKDPMLNLLSQSERAEKECADCERKVELAKEVLKINEESLAKAKEVFAQAKAAVEEQEAATKTAKNEYDKALTAQAEAKETLNKINKEIEEINSKTIYLIDPWYSDNLPAYGVFVSTIAIDGYSVEHVNEKEYLPELKDEDVFSFKATDDYRLAREFVGLVKKYRAEKKQHTLLLADERVKKMIENS